ncbi:MAG: response regulator [Desulfobacterales bacterium]|nr:response regulator [Desulfobacterales bacterium]
MNSPHASFRERILVVDQDTTFSQNCVAHLQASGFKTLEATTASHAWELLECRSADMIIISLDATLEGGASLIPRIRENWPQIPIILSGTTQQATDITRASRQDAAGLIFKPLTKPAMLTHVIKNALASREGNKDQGALKRLLEGARLKEKTKRLRKTNQNLTLLTQRLKEVVNSSGRLSSCATLESFASQLLEEFGRHLGASGGSIYIASKEGLRLVHCLDGSHAPNLIAYPVKKNSPFGSALRMKEPLVINNIHDQEELRPSGYDGYRNGSFVIFPLQNPKGRPFGLISLHGKTTPPFIQQDREVGTLLAAYSSETLRAVRATEALAKSEERYRLAAQTATDLIGEWNQKSDRLTWMGDIDALLGSLPESRPTTMGAWLSMVHPNDRKRMKSHYHMGAQGKTLPPTDYRVRHQAHGWLHLRERMATMEKEDGSSCVIRACNDITREKISQKEQAKNELKMQHSQRLESLGVIAGGIAHDFNNILMAVLGHADIALDEVETNSVAASSLNNIISAGRRASELAQQLLAYSGKGQVKTEPLNLPQLITDMMGFIRVNISKKVKITIQAGEYTPHVEGNKSQLRQVILNLVTNASQAIGNENGTITIATGKSFCTRNELDAATIPLNTDTEAPLPEGTYAFIDIEDSGCGMNKEALKKLFDPFFTTKTTGTGLGMAAVLSITRQHRGTMQINSTPEKGTRIRVLLPASQEPVPTAAPQTGASRDVSLPPNKGTILVADDEEPVRNISRRMLEKMGFTVVMACDGEEAVSLFEHHQKEVRCVILDMTMPGLNGMEALTKIREIEPEAPAIIASGYGMETQQVKEDCTYLQKPYQSSELKKALKNTLDAQ